MNKKLFLITTLCLFSSSVSWSQGEDIFWNNGVTHYDGEFRYATRHGQGTLTTTYEGWPTRGQGTYTFVNGDQYIGEWIYMKTPSFNNVKTNPKVFKDIILQGQGTYTSVNGDQYVGKWANGYPKGQGTATFANGSTYVGEFKNGKIEGKGTLAWASGNKYVGEFKDGNFHGQGTSTFADGSKHVGEWRNDKVHGQGTFISANGDKYVGEWKDDKYHGQGTFTSANNGKIQQGLFENGEYVFLGNEKEKKILKEKGQCIEGNCNEGYGVLEFPNKGKIIGYWQDGKRHGSVTMIYPDGRIYKGEWIEGRYITNDIFGVESTSFNITPFHLVGGFFVGLFIGLGKFLAWIWNALFWWI